MSPKRYLSILVAMSLITIVGGDEGDEFSNNLFTDLAPLLTLFGERVTMQFMSQSIGWADNIILAMAPLGVITTIVGAIRVGSPSWLKAVIGRARENLAVAEMELMSSTSKEVCELWNGQEIVRCMGSAPVTEFVCIISPGAQSMADTSPVETYTFDGLIKGKDIEKIDLGFVQEFRRWRAWWNDIRQWQHNKNGPQRSDIQIEASSSKPIVGRLTTAEAPNITLNAHNQLGRGELYLAAAAATALQFGVLIFSGFATFHPAMRWRKEDQLVAGYAFPCNVAGTLILVAGMLLCAHVVESRSTNTHYLIKNGKQARMVWLQKTQTVNDQDFKSYAIFAEGPHTVITTSRRTEDESSQNTILQLKAVIGAGAGVCGYVVQFVGLRGLHFSAPIAQLVAVVIMVCLRAFVRRGLAKPLRCTRLDPGFELDWFAMKMGSIKTAPWLDDTNSTEKMTDIAPAAMKSWELMPCDGSDQHTLLKPAEPPEAGESPEESEAGKIMNIRTQIAELANWKGIADVEAVSLARAIEVTMDNLCSDSRYGQDMIWTLGVRYGGSPQHVHFRLQRSQRGWAIRDGDIEAVLSLLIYSATQLMKDTGAASEVISGRGSRLRARESTAKQSLRFLGAHTKALHRDIQWWFPSGVIPAVRIEQAKEHEATLTVERHRITGCRPEQEDQTQEAACYYKMHDLQRLGFDEITKPSSDGKDLGSGDVKKLHLGAVSYESVELSYAQDLFSAFMWAVSKTMTSPVEGGIEIQSEDSEHLKAWQNFSLRNSRVSKIAQDIRAVGLGNLNHVYRCIIPPLSATEKLPPVDALVNLTRQHTKQYEEKDHWLRATDTYLWLFNVASTFSASCGIVIKATAVLVEHLRTLSSACQTEDGSRDLETKEECRKRVEEALRTVDHDELLSDLMRLYSYQQRPWDCCVPHRTPDSSPKSTQFPKAFNVPDERWAFVYVGSNIRDIHHWTPLHYEVTKNVWGKWLYNKRANVNAQDLIGWTPLHYASDRGETSFVKALLQEGARISLFGRHGATPLHCAASKGHTDVLRLLVEAGASVHAADARGNTPLFWAVMNGHKSSAESAKYLWPMTNRMQQNNSGITILHLACMHGRVDMMQIFLDSSNHREVSSESEERVRQRHPTDRRDLDDGWLQAKTSNGSTALHLAVKRHHTDLAKLLLNAGADAEARDGGDMTVLHYAARDGNADIVRYLLDKGANKDAMEYKGRRPLHAAASRGRTPIVQLLLEAGANKNPVDHRGHTPLYYADKSGHGDIEELLLEAGDVLEGDSESVADVSQADSDAED